MIQIGQASVDNAADILALQKQAYLQEAELYNDYSIPPLTQTLESITKDFEKLIFLKAVQDGSIVGSVRGCLEKDSVAIGRLIVDPFLQGQGIGTILMEAIENHFPECSRFELFTGTKSDRNIRLYKRLGYDPFREEEIHPGLTLVFLEKIVK